MAFISTNYCLSRIVTINSIAAVNSEFSKPNSDAMIVFLFTDGSSFKDEGPPPNNWGGWNNQSGWNNGPVPNNWGGWNNQSGWNNQGGWNNGPPIAICGC